MKQRRSVRPATPCSADEKAGAMARQQNHHAQRLGTFFTAQTVVEVVTSLTSRPPLPLLEKRTLARQLLSTLSPAVLVAAGYLERRGGDRDQADPRSLRAVRLRHGAARSATAVYRRLIGAILITDLEHLEGLNAARAAQLDGVADLGLHQRARDRRDPADLAVGHVGLVDADDRDGALGAAVVGVADGGAEEHPIEMTLPRRADDLGDLEPLRQVADAPVDLAQPLLAIDVVA